MSAEPVEGVCVRRPWSTWTKCRCPGCARKNARIKKLHTNGRMLTVEQRTRIRLEAGAAITRMLDAGWSPAAVADAYGLRINNIRSIAERHAAGFPLQPVLGVSMVILGGRKRRPRVGLVPAVGSTRRLRALAATGWPTYLVGARSGLSRSVVSEVRRGLRRSVSVAVADAVEEVYAVLQSEPGPSDRVRRRAAVDGWVGPGFWDDIDDPGEEPLPPVETERGIDLADAMMLARTGCDPEVAARRLGFAGWSSLERSLRRRPGGREVAAAFRAVTGCY